MVEQVEFKLSWREAGPPNHHDDKVDSDSLADGGASAAGAGDGPPLLLSSLELSDTKVYAP